MEPRPLHNLVSNCIPYSAFRISHLLILLTYFCMVFKCHSSLLKLFIVRTHTLNICCFCPYPSTHTHTLPSRTPHPLLFSCLFLSSYSIRSLFSSTYCHINQYIGVSYTANKFYYLIMQNLIYMSCLC